MVRGKNSCEYFGRRVLGRKSSEGLRALAGMLGAVKRRVLAWIELFWGMELDYCYHVIMGIYRAYNS